MPEKFIFSFNAEFQRKKRALSTTWHTNLPESSVRPVTSSSGNREKQRIDEKQFVHQIQVKTVMKQKDHIFNWKATFSE